MGKKKIALLIPPTLLVLWLIAIHTGLIEQISGTSVNRGPATAVAVIYTFFGFMLLLIALYLRHARTWMVIASIFSPCSLASCS